jgi:hypothetical protein
MPRRLKKSTGGWMTPVSSCISGQPGPHPPAPPALPTSSVNPFLPSPSVGGMAPVEIPSSMPSPPLMNANKPTNVQSPLAPHPSPNNNTGQPLAGGVLDPLSQAIMFANTNPYIIGCFMLVLNLGGRFLSLELTKKQEEFLSAPWLRPALFFTVIFIATRNLAAAFWVSLLFFSIIWVVANEHSPYCLVPSWCGHDMEKETKTYQENAKKVFALKVPSKTEQVVEEQIQVKPPLPKE